jgi:hypothetical protein
VAQPDSSGTNISSVVNEWSEQSGVIVTKEARLAMATAVNEAITTVSQRHPALAPARIGEAAPETLHDYLSRSQSTGRSPSLSSLLEQKMLLTGQVVPRLTLWPTIAVQIIPYTPLDFSIFINGTDYSAARMTSPPANGIQFRVVVGQIVVRVLRPGKMPCEKTLDVTEASTNQVVCRL